MKLRAPMMDAGWSRRLAAALLFVAALGTLAAAAGSGTGRGGQSQMKMSAAIHSATVNPPGWDLIASPNANAINTLRAVTCDSANDCWAVGYTKVGSSWNTLIERWNGTSWSVVTSPNHPVLSNSSLYGVACSAPNDCWAVGDATPNVGVAQTMIEHWDGVSWSLATSINPSVEQDAVLYGVACSSASSCWAVGYYYNGTTNQTLIERWDGTAWTVATSPDTSALVVNVLNGVTCVSDSDCWAVGNHSPGIPVGVGASPEQTLAMHWDGSAWTIVATPTPTNNYDILLGVSCASSTDCMAVGFFPVGVIYRTLAEHWDGSAWTIVSTPNVNSDQDNVLNGVACRSGVGCWAAGYYNAGDISSPMQQTLIEHWDGSAWIIAPSPNSSITLRNYLYAVTCSSAAECWTTGNWDTATGADTLIERYTAPVLELRSIARLNDGRIVLSGIANANLTVLAADAPDPAGFEAIGTATRNDTGGFVFEDVDAIGRDRRFYRLGFQ